MYFSKSKKNERDYFLARRAEAARLLVVVLLAAVVRRAVDVRCFAVVRFAVCLELVLFVLLVEALPRILRRSDLIPNYQPECIKALCGKC